MSTLICAPLLVTGCTTAGEPSAPPLKPGASSFSDYLVGQYAVRHRQMKEAADFLSSAKTTPDLPEQLGQNLNRQLFTILAGEGRLDEAADIAQKLTTDHLMARVVLIVEDVVSGDMAQALKGADELSDKGLGAYIKPLIHAWLIAANKGADAALKSLDGFKKQEGLEALYHLHAGLLNQFGGQLTAAETHYKKAAEGPNGMSLRLAELYGTMLVKQDRMEEALAVYQAYFNAHPDSLYIQAVLDDLNSGVLKDRPAISVQDGLAETLFGLSSSLRSHSTRQAGLIMGRLALRVKPDFPLAQILVAEILESDERYKDANVVYALIPKTNPFSWSARLRMALNLDDIGQTDDAIQILEEMVKQHPERLEALVTLGDVLRHRDYFEKAQAVYAKAIALIGDNVGKHHWNLFYSRGITLERLKRWDEAEPLFLKALELEPKQPFVLNYLGYSWIEIGRNMEKAQKMIEEAVAQRPRDGYIVDSLGWVLYRIGDYERAVPHLERAVELQPSDPVINDHLGDAYWKVGRNREARFQWYRAKSLNPDDDILVIIEQKIKSGLVEE
ncbi:tetratricopeptide repeat protein [Terasakiella sp. SH-1]|uniref:tetratricopeptide repeat protein n=1 Tax=Terasakiella sp. SH-1 TaxID=2560057 RepID=UPI0014310C42|nr:tetratricopeptide repeat protein [Terasakiella sp. SH-1]